MINNFDPSILKNLYKPSKDSHKGQNGKLMIIGGSKLFHAASLWSLEVASRIVDMVFYSSIPENNKIVAKLKEEFRDGIVVPRQGLESYIEEADCILIGPGMVRAEGAISNIKYQISNIKDIEEIEDEGQQTYFLTKYLLNKYPKKRWVIDGGALQMMDAEWLGKIDSEILTPHHKEFTRVFGVEANDENASKKAGEYSSIILLKGGDDIVCSASECTKIPGGNPGMTKGGTGDVLAGLVAALYCKNDAFLSAATGSYINKKAGDSLYSRVGSYFNASDLAKEVSVVMKNIFS